MLDLAGFQPVAQAAAEIVVLEVLAPKRAEFDARFAERAIEVEQTDQTRPCAAPIRDGEDRSSVCQKALQNMVAVLPNRLRDNQRFIGGNFPEDLHSVLLAVNELVIFFGFET